jgi:cytoskeletal protein CcmA (bactofilin family)
MASQVNASKLPGEAEGGGRGQIANGSRNGAMRAAGAGVSRSPVLTGPAFEAAQAAEVTTLARSDSASGRWMITGRGEVLGSFTGEIDCASDLVIGRGADVSATIRGLDVVVAGLVRGNIIASGRLQITASGRVEGDARVGSLIVHEGGVHRGSMTVYPEGLPEDEEGYVEPAAELAQPGRATPQATAAALVKRFWGEIF